MVWRGRLGGAQRIWGDLWREEIVAGGVQIVALCQEVLRGALLPHMHRLGGVLGYGTGGIVPD